MPKLQDFRKTKVITFPSFPESKVEIYSALLVKDMLELRKVDGDSVEVGLKALPLYIKSWNFTDESDQLLQINIDNLNFLQEDDLAYIFEEIKKFQEESKKK